MYIYATLGGGIHRFSTMGWIKWLEHVKARGSKAEIDKFSKFIAPSYGEMLDWDVERAQMELEEIAEERKHRKRKSHGR